MYAHWNGSAWQVARALDPNKCSVCGGRTPCDIDETLRDEARRMANRRRILAGLPPRP